MGRKSLKEDQQQRIIQAFYTVAQQEGIENTSFAKIAKALDMPPSLIVHYFGTKEELLLGLIDFIVENYQRIYEPELRNSDPLTRLTTILNNIFSRKWNRYVDDSVFYSCFALVFRDTRIRESFKEMSLLLRQWLADAIQVCMDEQLLTVTSAAEAADLIFVISDGAYYFLSMIDDADLYHQKLRVYKKEAFKVLHLQPEPTHPGTL